MPTLCKIEDLPSEGCKSFSLEGIEIFVINDKGHYRAYVNQCPHLGIELNWAPDKFLDLSQSHIQCSMHGALFNISDGECVHGPCLGDFLQPVQLEIQNNLVDAIIL